MLQYNKLRSIHCQLRTLKDIIFYLSSIDIENDKQAYHFLSGDIFSFQIQIDFDGKLKLYFCLKYTEVPLLLK